jgi:hypothetical protein
MKKLSPKVFALLSALLLISACSNTETSSSIGKDIVESIDSSVNYDGVFNTISVGKEWSSFSDPLSGFHQFDDSLGREGNKQLSRTVGIWNNEEAITYTTFSPTADSTGIVFTNSIYHKIWELESKLLDTASNVKSYSTSLLFAIDPSKTSAETIDIKLSTGPYIHPDSPTHPDTSKLTTIGYTTVYGDSLTGSFDIDFNYESILDTAETHHSVFYSANILTLEYSQKIDTSIYQHGTIANIGDSVTYNVDSVDYIVHEDKKHALTTTILHDTTLVKSATPSDTSFQNSEKVFTQFTNELYYPLFDIATVDAAFAVDSMFTKQYQLYKSGNLVDADITNDKINLAVLTHFYKVETKNITADTIINYGNKKDTLLAGDILTTTTDSISLPAYNDLRTDSDTTKDDIYILNIMDTAAILNEASTTVRHLIDTLNYAMLRDTTITYNDGFVVQKSIKYTKTTNKLRSLRSLKMRSDDKPKDIDPTAAYNFYITISEDEIDKLLFLHTPRFRVIAQIADSTDTTIINSDTTIITPDESMVFVTDPTNSLTDLDIATSGGLERVAHLKLNTDSLWASVRDNNYLSMVHASLRIWIDSKKSTLPTYHNNSIDIRGIVLANEVSSVEELLKTNSSTQFYHNVQFPVEADSTDTLANNLNIIDNMLDIHFDSKLFSDESQPLPETHLYLWIDGAEMGRVFFNTTEDAKLTYIIQDKK